MICDTCAYAPQCYGMATEGKCGWYHKATPLEPSDIVKELLKEEPF